MELNPEEHDGDVDPDTTIEEQPAAMDLTTDYISAETAEPTAVAELAKCYRVIGPHAVLDTAPGETFTTVLDPGQETFLTEVGHIEIVGATPDATTESAESADRE